MASRQVFQTAFDSYTVESVRGEGGPGRVFVVVSRNGERFAIKTLKLESLTTNRVLRFKSEIRFCLTINHPNIVPVLDYGLSEGTTGTVPFYVMPLFDRTLRADMPFDNQGRALQVYAQILDGVEAAHLHGVWHRDIKPENILMSDHAVVADFGVAHFSEPVLQEAIKTQDKERLANFVYAAPEQRRGGQADGRADMFSLGLLLNEMITGEVPLGIKYRTIGAINSDYAYLDEIVEMLILQNPDERIQTIKDLKREISARGTRFLAAQELRGSESKVVPEYAADLLEEITISAVDIDNGSLIIELNGEPPKDWVTAFNQGHFGHTAVYGYEPQRFQFKGRRIIVPNIKNHLAQGIVDRFKDWVPVVTELVEGQRKEMAARLRREAEVRIQKEIKDKKDRLDTLRDLRF